MLGILEKFRRDLQAASLAPLSRHQIGLALGLLHDALVMLEQEVAVRRACKFAAAGDAGSLARSLVLLRGLDGRDPGGQTPLHAAASAGRAGCAELLLTRGADPEMLCPLGRTPLMLAAAAGHDGAVGALLRNSAAVDTASPHGVTALVLAAGAGVATTVALLLNAGGDAQPNRGVQPVHAAGAMGHAEVVEMLLVAGASPMATRDGRGDSLLSVAAFRGHLAVVELLLRANAPVSGRTMTMAAGGGSCDVMLALLRREPRANQLDGDTPLVVAARAGHADMVLLLLGRGSPNCGAALMAAAANGDPSTVTALVRGAARDVVNHRSVTTGHTALMVAVKGGHLKPVLTLLAHPDTDVNAQTHAGRTALMFAAKRGDLDVVKLLLVAGADAQIMMHDGGTLSSEAMLRRSAFAQATLRGHAKTAGFLRLAGRWPPFQIAVAIDKFARDEARDAFGGMAAAALRLADRAATRGALAYVLQTNGKLLAADLARRAALGWSPSRHCLHHDQARGAICTVFLVAGRAPLPTELWLLVCSHVFHGDWPITR